MHSDGSSCKHRVNGGLFVGSACRFNAEEWKTLHSLAKMSVYVHVSMQVPRFCVCEKK